MTSQARYDLAGDPKVVKVEIGPKTLDDPSLYHATSVTVFGKDTQSGSNHALA
jgi:hypothetical protein